MNNYMEALNGWNTTAKNLNEVRWQLEMFSGACPSSNYWDYELNNYTKEYTCWKNKPENKITYLDKLCGFERKSPIEAYGFKQGYFSIDDVIELLKRKNSVKVYFSWCYDVRQYIENMDNCYMEITKI